MVDCLWFEIVSCVTLSLTRKDDAMANDFWCSTAGQVASHTKIDFGLKLLATIVYSWVVISLTFKKLHLRECVDIWLINWLATTFVYTLLITDWIFKSGKPNDVHKKNSNAWHLGDRIKSKWLDCISDLSCTLLGILGRFKGASTRNRSRK